MSVRNLPNLCFRGEGVETIKSILEKGNINQGILDHSLLCCVSRGSIEIMKLLLNCGANPNNKPYDLLRLAKGNDEVIDLLINNMNSKNLDEIRTLGYL